MTENNEPKMTPELAKLKTAQEVKAPAIDFNELGMLLHIEEKIRPADHPTLKALHDSIMRVLSVHNAKAAEELIAIKKEEADKAQAEAAQVATQKAALEAKARQDALDAEAKAKAEQEARDKAVLENAPKVAATDGTETVRRD